MNINQKPASVRRAMRTGDGKALRRLGKAGARERTKRLKRRQDMEDADQVRKEERDRGDEDFRREQAGEHILPPDIHN